MKKFVALTLGLALTGQAWACSCVDWGISSENARTAKNVFVFRLLATELLSEPSGEAAYRVEGRIQVLANVRGRTSTRKITYSTYYCCGIRMETGKQYIGFTQENTVSLAATSGNVLPIWGSFDRSTADALEAVLRGRRKLEEAFEYGSDEIHQMRPPPPPCPSTKTRSR